MAKRKQTRRVGQPTLTIAEKVEEKNCRKDSRDQYGRRADDDSLCHADQIACACLHTCT